MLTDEVVLERTKPESTRTPMPDKRKTRAGKSESSIQDSSSKLLPRVGMLGVLTVFLPLVAGLEGLPHAPRTILIGIASVVGMIYLAWVVGRTIDSMAVAVLLYRHDRWVYRYSGLFACGLAALLLLFVVIGVSVAGAAEPIFLRNRLILQILHLLMEVGLILCTACLWARSTLDHVKPVLLWKSLSVPLLIAFGTFVVLMQISMITSTFGVK